MNKKEMLLDLKKYIESGKYIVYRYFKDDCYCSIGYLMNKCNISNDTLENLSTNAVSFINESYVSKLLESGFTRLELSALQRHNDDSEQEELLEYINELIEGCENE